MISCRSEPIRSLVRRQCRDFGVDIMRPDTIHETLLRDGEVDVGIVFRAGRVIAIWDIAAANVRFYDDRARRLRTIKVDASEAAEQQGLR